MKEYSTDAYYRYAKRLLLEGDSDNNQIPDKSDDKQFKKLIISASAGGVGAIACIKYLNNVFSIDSLQSAVKTMRDNAKWVKETTALAKDEKWAKHMPSIWKKISGAIQGLVAKALNWVQRFCKGILKQFPSLKKPIYGGPAYKAGANVPTYGSVLCMALVGAAVGAVIYKIYKFIKNKRKKTESVAAYNLRKDRELNLILEETTIFFNNLDMLSENDAASERATIRDFAKKNLAHRGNPNVGQTLTAAEKRKINAANAAFRKRIAAARRNADARRYMPVARPSTPVNSDYDVGGALWQTGAANPTDTLKMSGTYDPNTMDATTRMAQNAKANASAAYNKTTDLTARRAQMAKDNAAYQRRLQAAKRAGIDAGEANRLAQADMAGRAAKYGYSDPNMARMSYSKVPQATLDKIQATKVANTSYMQMANGKVNALYKNPVTGETISKTISRAEVPKGATIVNSPKLQKIAAQRAGIDAGEAKRLADADKIGQASKGVTTTATKDVPAKAESFLDSVKNRVMEMWNNVKTWCSNNPVLATMIGICAALIACWYGVKKYKEHKAKKAADIQTA